MPEELKQYYLASIEDFSDGETKNDLGSQSFGEPTLFIPGDQPPTAKGVTEAQVRSIVTEMLQNLTPTGSFSGTNKTIPGYQLMSNDYLPAGEYLEQGEAVCIINDFKQVNNDQDSDFGDDAARTYIALSFTPATQITSTTIKTIIKKVASPVDNVTVEIQSDSNGSPSGTAITNGTSNNVGGGSLSTEYVLTSFAFSSAFTLSANTKYWLVIKRSGAVDAVNYYTIRTYSTNYATFSAKTYNGSSWSASSTLIYMDITLASGDNSTRLWKADSDVLALSSFAGFSAGRFLPNTTGKITTTGIDKNQSGLTRGATYYVSGTPGQISTSPGTYGSKIGFAISDTEIQLSTSLVMSGTQDSFELINNTTDTVDHVIITGFKPRSIQLIAGSSTTGAGISWGFIASTSLYNCFYSLVGTGTANNDSAVTSSYVAFIPDGAMNEFASATLVDILDNGFILRWKNGSATAGRFIVYNWLATG